MVKTQSKKAGKKKLQRRNVPLRSGDVLVTQRMLSETKGELKSDITSVRLEVTALREEMNGRFVQVDARFTQMDSKLETVIAAIHRTNALVEEQNSRNRVVLDGYTSLYDHQVHTNKRLDAVEKVVFGKEQK